jgi:hypothetical protein
MAEVNTNAIERKLDRIRSLGVEDLRREWRRLYHGAAYLYNLLRLPWLARPTSPQPS